MEPRVICKVPWREGLAERLQRDGCSTGTEDGMILAILNMGPFEGGGVKLPADLNGEPLYVECSEYGGLHEKPTDQNSWAAIACAADGHPLNAILLRVRKPCGTSAVVRGLGSMVSVSAHLSGENGCLRRHWITVENGLVTLSSSELWSGNPHNHDDGFPAEFRSAMDAAQRKVMCPGCRHAHYYRNLDEQ